MTSKLIQQTTDAGALEKFPDFPPREDMQNSLFLDRPAHQAALEEHFGDHDTAIILSEIPVRRVPGQRAGHRIPDLLVAFGVNRALAVAQNGYSIQHQGKPPDLVLEVASESTKDEDLDDKRRDYANFGIPEYWRFDPTGRARYGEPIAGDRLVDGAYQPIEIVEIEPEHFHGHSEILSLFPCWDHGQLRFYDPATGQHLMTFAEERQARIAEQEALRAEREARIAEQEALRAARARVQELEEELKKRDQD